MSSDSGACECQYVIGALLKCWDFDLREKGGLRTNRGLYCCVGTVPFNSEPTAVQDELEVGKNKKGE